MARIRKKYENVPLDLTKEKESREARKRAIEVEDMEIAEAFARYRQIRKEQLERQNRESLKENEYLI